MLDVRRLALLRDLAHLGTIAAVAQARAYTPSAVSQQLAVLEREAGVPLLQRTGRRVTLTTAGARLVEHTGEILAALERADAGLAAARTGLSGRLRIGAFTTAVHTVLPAALVALGREYPGLELMVRELDPVEVPDALRAGQLDVALVHDYDLVPIEPDPALDTEPLFEETMYLARPWPPPAGDGSGNGNGNGNGNGDGDGLGSCRDRPWIMASPGTLCHRMAVRTCGAAGFTPQIRHQADDFATVLALVAAGQGVALVPQLAIPAGTPSGTAPSGTAPSGTAPSGVALTALPTRRRTRIAYRRGAGTHPAVAAGVAAIRGAAVASGDVLIL